MKPRILRLVPALLFLGVLAAGAAVPLLIGVSGTLQLIGVVALLALAFAAASVAAAALVVRRRLGELQHLPDLGRRFVTRYEQARIVGLTRDGRGVSIVVDSDQVSTVVLDEQGTPDHIAPSVAGTSRWHVDGLDVEHLARLQGTAAEHGQVTVMATGMVGLTGPVPVEWRLETADGMVLTAHG